MKKIYLLLLLVAISFGICEEINVTTWNLANFGENKLENEDVVDKILTILEDSHVICLQEINQIVNVRGDVRNSVEILRDKLSQKTNIEWKLTLSDLTGEGGKTERYAFLWRAGLGTLLESKIVSFTCKSIRHC